MSENYISFAKENITKILEKLEKTRIEKDHRNYRTLANSLKEVIDILWRQHDLPDKNDLKFLSDLVDKLNKETEEIHKLQTASLDDNKYKEFHDWLLSFEKIESQIIGINDVIRIRKNTLKLMEENKRHSDK